MTLDPRSRLGRPVGRRFLFEWLGVGCLGVIVVLFGAVWHLTNAVDHLVYDRFLEFRATPVLDNVVVVEIDNASIARIGRWPWPRAVHAEVLERIAAAQPAAIVYDVLFTESSPDDARFARSIAANHTFLPILLSPENADGTRNAVQPVAPLAQAASGLGHINLEVDSDGIVRSVALFEGDAHSHWPQLTLPLWRAISNGTVPLAPPPGGTWHTPGSHIDDGSEQRFLIPFSPLAESYRKVSFASLLNGEVSPDVLRGRIVLIGATASGLYDRFATPVSGELGLMPGVYIHANVLDSLLTGRTIEPTRSWVVFIASLVPLGVLLAGFLVLSPWRSLLLAAGLCAFTAAGSAALLYGARVWASPMPAIVGLIAVYPIWNWRRLEMTMSYLRKELQRLADEPYLLPGTPRRSADFGGDALEKHMSLMAQAAQRVQDMKRFVWDSLDSVPEPILVSDVAGVVLIANQAAKAHFARIAEPSPEGRPIRDIFGDLTYVKSIDESADVDGFARTHWPALLDPARDEFETLMEKGIEVSDRNGRDHLLRYAKCTNAQGEATGWIAGLVDVTALHAAERHREDALRLLSHDMRSPQASILALVEIERARIESDRMRELLERIERYAQRALTLADDFVQLARAESQTYVLEPVNFGELLIDASDEVWPQAHAKHIRLETQFPDEDDAENGADACWISADRSLITRALVNILNNAVKYSPPDTQILCTIERVESTDSRRPHVQCTIRDQGYGIPVEQQAKLFERFHRFHETERPDIGGAGLGMAFVKTVVTRHGGDVYVDSAPGKGTAFTLALPALDETTALPSDIG
ncbi:CHASE2 domain-containing protein [Paraburkholderia flava]|uniref:CHASE2 domain-containing protein n=1 Tax=Paraburkholderia flava TaxID=2547393 RepID=UPI001060FD58|nr:CHASE2 domain-containing protein [Paraburkholderia flava]